MVWWFPKKAEAPRQEVFEDYYDRERRLRSERDAERARTSKAFLAERIPAITRELLAADVADRALVQQEHQRDRDLYRLFPKRHGDFLTLFITRQLTSDSDDEPVKLSTSINLHTTKRVLLRNGQEAGLHGEARFLYTNPSEYNYTTEYKLRAVSSVQRFKQRYLTLPIGESELSSVVPEYHEALMYYEKVEGLSAFAVSDMIEFHGEANEAIPVPFGMGEEIHARIMAEIGQGYVPPTIKMLA